MEDRAGGGESQRKRRVAGLLGVSGDFKDPVCEGDPSVGAADGNGQEQGGNGEYSGYGDCYTAEVFG